MRTVQDEVLVYRMSAPERVNTRSLLPGDVLAQGWWRRRFEVRASSASIFSVREECHDTWERAIRR